MRIRKAISCGRPDQAPSARPTFATRIGILGSAAERFRTCPGPSVLSEGDGSLPRPLWRIRPRARVGRGY